MESPGRRRVVRGVAASLALAGCTSPPGHDPTLHLHNDYHEPVDLRIAVYRAYVGEGRGTEELFFEETVSVDADESTELEVFTADVQYRVVLERGDHVVRFPTRPICSSASTTVTVRPSSALRYHVEFCEGGPHTGSSNSS